MDDLKKLIEQLNLPKEKLENLVKAAQENPFLAMGMVKDLGIKPEILQQLFAAMIQDPAPFFEMAKKLGLSDEALGKVAEQVDRFKK